MFSEVIGLQIVQKGDDKELARRTKKTDSSKSASSPCMSLCMLSWSCIAIVIAAEDECIFSKRANVFEVVVYAGGVLRYYTMYQVLSSVHSQVRREDCAD